MGHNTFFKKEKYSIDIIKEKFIVPECSLENLLPCAAADGKGVKPLHLELSHAHDSVALNFIKYVIESLSTTSSHGEFEGKYADLYASKF